MNPAHAPYSVPPLKPHPAQLYVVTCVANPARYRSLYRLYRSFAEHVAAAGAILYTVEAAFGTRPFEVTEAGNPHHIQVRTSEELWLKENLMNLGIARLPADAQFIATIDADFTFVRGDWAQETIQQLQHYAVVQMFNQVAYLDPDEKIISHRTPFVENKLRASLHFHRDRSTGAMTPGGYPNGSEAAASYLGPPGGAWAYRRASLDALGALIDYCILGAGDYFMAAGLFGLVDEIIPAGYAPEFRAQLLQWQDRAVRAVRSNVGVVPGVALHHWHGPMRDRNYQAREQILVKYDFTPAHDLKRDSQGLWQLEDDHTPRFSRMRDDIRSYFRARNEDSVDQ
jgi:hypothetical protein